ncbi:MAG TPA: hypothetical protein HPP58_03025 [Deltaproteobacteria bacterium]|nr:hypothetical protein [Deltaproteobacteria bacterium]HIJ41204.1 hypothetical protein [Deltaproteobacteria bacterium]
MEENRIQNGRQISSDMVQCGKCLHFRYFENRFGHYSPNALGRCAGKSWDGNRGQWAMFRHRCKYFAPKPDGSQTDLEEKGISGA